MLELFSMLELVEVLLLKQFLENEEKNIGSDLKEEKLKEKDKNYDEEEDGWKKEKRKKRKKKWVKKRKKKPIEKKDAKVFLSFVGECYWEKED